MARKTTVTNREGREFNVRVVEQGDVHGKDMRLTYEGQMPLVEFYDAQHKGFGSVHDGQDLGQFVSGYLWSTIIDSAEKSEGINLDGGVPAWTLDNDALQRVVCELKKMDVSVPEITASSGPKL